MKSKQELLGSDLSTNNLAVSKEGQMHGDHCRSTDAKQWGKLCHEHSLIYFIEILKPNPFPDLVYHMARASSAMQQFWHSSLKPTVHQKNTSRGQTCTSKLSCSPFTADDSTYAETSSSLMLKQPTEQQLE